MPALLVVVTARGCAGRFPASGHAAFAGQRTDSAAVAGVAGRAHADRTARSAEDRACRPTLLHGRVKKAVIEAPADGAEPKAASTAHVAEAVSGALSRACPVAATTGSSPPVSLSALSVPRVRADPPIAPSASAARTTSHRPSAARSSPVRAHGR
ncbi:hypothetical protein Shyhy01_61170 [Streptomyces hygroscopicus subsp. hygroscopicus]|nr:hypothetical protein Shyhy01_61170 [Streptomyces hygroscopicus subsp. hygroscopicus]